MQIAVLGMHRSGTSLVSRLLNMSGVYFGSEGVSTGANEQNPKGFWERRDVRNVNDDILRSVGCDWDQLENFDLSRLGEVDLKRLRKAVGEVVLNMDAHRPWFIKEPRLCLTLPVWRPFFEMPVALVVSRHPVEVAQSLLSRNKFPISLGLALWEAYTIRLLENLKDIPFLIAHHESLLADPVSHLREILSSLRSLGIPNLRMPTELEITSFVDPLLYRAKSDTAHRDSMLSASQRKLWEFFSKLQPSTKKPFPEFALPKSSLSELKAHHHSARESSKLLAQISDYKTRITELEESLNKNKEAEAAKLKKLTKQGEDYEVLRAKVAHVENQRSRDLAELMETRSQLEARSKESRHLKEQLSAKQTHIEGLGVEIARLSKAHDSAKALNTELRSSLEDSQKNSNGFQTELTARRKQEEKLQAEFQKLQAQFEKLTAENQDLQRIRQESLSRIQEFGERNTVLKTQVQDREVRIEELKQKLEATEALCREVTELRRKSTKRIEELEKSLKATQAEIPGLKARAKKAVTELAAAAKKAQQAQAMQSKLQHENIRLQGLLNQAKLDLQKAQTSQQAQQLELESMKKGWGWKLSSALLPKAQPKPADTPNLKTPVEPTAPMLHPSQKAELTKKASTPKGTQPAPAPKPKTPQKPQKSAPSATTATSLQIFDKEYYLSCNPELRKNGADPVKHYLSVGWKKGRRPHRLFDVQWLLSRNKQLAASKQEPLAYYLKEGWKKGEMPHPLIDPAWYRQQNPKLKNVDPLRHYLKVGWKQGLSPHPLFDTKGYLKQFPDLLQKGIDPLTHYLTTGWKQGAKPHPLFNPNWYLEKNPELKKEGKEPLQHFLRIGWKANRNPHPLFHTRFYLAKNPEVRNSGMDPLSHFLKFGATKGTNPNAGFSTKEYLQKVPELRSLGINPLVHFVVNRQEKETANQVANKFTPKTPAKAKAGTKKEAPSSSPLLPLAAATPAKPAVPCATQWNPATDPVDVVVCVHNALADVRVCLETLHAKRTPHMRIIIVNDGSDVATTEYLETFSRTFSGVELHSSPVARGYTKAANQGVRAANAPFIVMLNSDTIVSTGWIQKLITCAQSDVAIGIVGAISNCATWQSVPEVTGPSGDWALNPIHEDSSVDEMAEILAKESKRQYPDLPLLNGFCLLIKKEVFDSLGLFDEEGFPQGYGEENDFCLRAKAAGFRLVVADDCYIYHAKSKSYSPTGRKPLVEAAKQVLAGKYGKKTFEQAGQLLKSNKVLAELRERVHKATDRRPAWPEAFDASQPRIIYLLLCSGTGGGVLSVLQEAYELIQRGIETRVAIFRRHADLFYDTFPEFPLEMFLICPDVNKAVEQAGKYDIAIATIFTTVKILKQVIEKFPKVMPAYYIQDYEPLFAEEGSELHKEARDSYNLIPEMVRFAKTDWIRNIVLEKEAASVEKVLASIDRSVYFPAVPPRIAAPPLQVCAMVRPKTPRRGAGETIQLLRLLHEKFGNGIEITIFGSNPGDPLLEDLKIDFPHTNLGILTRRKVGAMLRQSDLFIDMSSYQAFGRTAVEAMASRCAVAVPGNCGTSEFAVDDKNAVILDTTDVAKCAEAIEPLLKDLAKLEEMKEAAQASAAKYNVKDAVDSILELLLRKRNELFQANKLRQPENAAAK